MRSQKDLEERIVMHNDAYRSGTPIVSDKRYDDLVSELKTLYPKSELLKKGVIEKAPVSRKETLPIRMASLNKCKSLDEIYSWLDNNLLSDESVIITPKFDGISLVNQNKDCWTRGDGFVGQKSNAHFGVIKNIGGSLPNEIVFGEAIMAKRVFEYKYSDEFKSPRNLVAGLFNSKSISEGLMDVDYIRYGIGESELSKVDQIKKLNEVNQVKCQYHKVKVSRLKTLTKEDFTDLYSSWSKDFAIDGLVFDIDDPELRKSLGREENGNPVYARALKLPEWNEDYKTKITNHKFQISKQGKLKGTVQFPVINIDGVDITQATFYNAKFLFDWGLAEGREIEIKRSGDVIPKIVSVEGIHVPLKEEFKTNKEYEAAYEVATGEILNKFSEDENVSKLSDELVECPCCGEQLAWDMNMVELVCTNENCKDIQIAKLVHFFKTLEFEDFGEEKIISLYNEGATTINTFLHLMVDNIFVLDGWGKISAQKLVSQIEKLKDQTISFSKLLTALDLWNGVLGEKDCQHILDNITEQSLFNLEQKRIDVIRELTLIKGVGEITAKAFQEGYWEWQSNWSHLPIIASYFKTPKQAHTGNECSEWNCVLTGFRSDEITAYITSNGGVISSGVSKKTTHLIVKDKNSTSSKMKKAQGFGCEILSKDEFETKYL